MNGLRKRKKFSKDHFFTFTQAVHASSVILFTHVKITRQ